MRELQVWGVITFAPNLAGQQRAIVAERSFAAVQRAFHAAGCGKPSRDYCCTTANETELQVALANPGVVFARGINDWHGDYKEVT